MSEASKLLYALAGLIAIHYAIAVYITMNDEGKDVVKLIIKCLIMCIACIVAANVIRYI